MPSLRTLEATFVRLADDSGSFNEDVTFAQAHGVMFLCPKCFAAKGGPVGTHSIICWSRSRGVPERVRPSGRWKLDGTSLDDLTLNGDAVGGGGARSVALIGGCAWHGFVTNGAAD